MQIGKRVRSSITEPRRTAQDKRFLERFQDNKEIGFAMLRLGATPNALKPDSCAPPHLPHPALLGAALAPCTSCPQCTLLTYTLECSMNTRMTSSVGCSARQPPWESAGSGGLGGPLRRGSRPTGAALVNPSDEDLAQQVQHP